MNTASESGKAKKVAGADSVKSAESAERDQRKKRNLCDSISDAMRDVERHKNDAWANAYLRGMLFVVEICDLLSDDEIEALMIEVKKSEASE